jgi:Protein of unknown function (DUF2796)
MKTVTLCILALFPAAIALADEAEHREHGPHVHGMAELNVALDGNVLWIELNSPAMNIVGFEHAPQSAEQKAAVHDATETLKDGGHVFGTSILGPNTTTKPTSTAKRTSTPTKRTRSSRRAIASSARRPMR